MTILVNRKVKRLFCNTLVIAVSFILLSAIIVGLQPNNSAWYVLLCLLLTSILMMVTGYRYFKEQNGIMENAIMQIHDCISGDHDTRIACDDEGELYRLFHEVNSLVSILNAHADNEIKQKIFLKNTISDISHQLKTPLSALNIYNGIMQEEAKDPRTIEKFASLSEQELDRTEALVQNLLKITKLDAGTIVIEKRAENLSRMMNDVERHFSFRAQKEGKQILLSGADSIDLLCDRDWLLEAISNIVKNAFDHTRNGNRICLNWKRLASVIQIIIKDDGSGIHLEDLPYIFKRFYRSRFSKDTQGIGLGLPLAKAIVEAHNGTIEVDSELGRGTTFTINILIPTKV